MVEVQNYIDDTGVQVADLVVGFRVLRGESLEPYCAELATTTRRQDNPPAYFPYGVAYVVKIPSLIEERTFYPRRCGFHVLKRYQGYEIDDLHDFLCVEAVMKHERRLP